MNKEEKRIKNNISNLFMKIPKSIHITLLFILFFLNIKQVFSSYLESFQKYEFTELDSLIEITDYYNLSIFMTTRGEIYTGIPPIKNNTISPSSHFTKFTSGVTYNENYILMSCTKNYLLGKINIITGEETPLINYNYTLMPNYTCGVFTDKEYVYISMSHILIPIQETLIQNNNSDIITIPNTTETEYLSSELNYFSDLYSNSSDNIENIEFEEINDNYDDEREYLEHSVLKIKLEFNEINGPIVNETYEIIKYTLGKKIQNYYMLPKSSVFSCETIKYGDSKIVCGYIEYNYGNYVAKGTIISENSNKVTTIKSLEKVSSGIKLQKLNSKTIIVLVSLYSFELLIKRSFGNFYISKTPLAFFDKFESAEDLFFFNNDFLFSSTGTANCMYIRRNNSFSYFKLKDPSRNITKVLGFYNELNDSLLFVYEFEGDKIVYFTLENMTFLYDFKVEPNIIQVISNTKTTFNVSDLIVSPDEHEVMQLESLNYFVDTKNRKKKYDKYIYDNETQNLTVYESDNDWIEFKFYYEGIKDQNPSKTLSYGFYFKNCKVTIRTCLFKCGSCNQTFDECSSAVCKQNFAMKRDDSQFECYANDQNFLNYKYYNESNYFEKCYKSCKFCSVIGKQSSANSHNCLVCDDNYLKSYQYPGNCYQILYPKNNSNYLKVANNINDENFTEVESCPTGKNFKIMDTGECVSSCPTTSPYNTYYLNTTLNLSLQEENFIGLLYPLKKETKIPKLKYHKGCYSTCPSYTKVNNTDNTCNCLYAWEYESDGDILCYDNEEFCHSYGYYYHDNTKECKKGGCQGSYFQFNLECYKDGCPTETQPDPNNNHICVSVKSYCYINEEYKTICGDSALPNYPLRYNNTNNYLADCNETLIYFNTQTYLYNKVCYIHCPIETIVNNTDKRCSCKYYIYYIDNDYECLQETEKCSDKDKYNISELKQCVDNKEECINLGYKVFNRDCLRDCPENTENNNNICLCKFYFLNESNILTCFEEGVTCETLGFPIKMQNKNECFRSPEECTNNGYKYFNNICYESCPDNTEDKNNNGLCLCKNNYINNTNQLTCLTEEKSCESEGYNYINLDTKECFTSLESCKNRDLKTFNDNCYSVCPRNTKENSTDTSSCICSYYFFTEENNKLTCFEQNEVCETVSQSYLYTNTETKECFKSMQSCIASGSLRICVNNCANMDSSTCNFVCDPRIDYLFNDICYKFYCPSGTRLDTSDPNSRTCICEEGSKINGNTGLTSCVYTFPEIQLQNKNNCPYLYNRQCVNKCPENACINSNTEELTVCVDMRPTTKKYNEICIEGINEYVQKIVQSENDEDIIPIVLPSGVALNAYPVEEDIEELIEKNPNLTYVDLGDCKNKLKIEYKLPDDTKLYILGIDTPNLYGNSTINVFNYEIYLKNGTQLEDLSACNNSKIIITSNIQDLEAAHFYKAIEFYEEGYDIYNRSNLFYQDYCAPAQDNENDITLVDRAKYYYPTAAICNDGCIYNMVDFDSKRFICKCNADLNDKIYSYEKNEHVEKDLVTKDEDMSYWEYFLSLMNYRIFLCINLFFEFKSFYYNAGFYISFSILLINISLMVVFWIKGLNHIRITLYKNIPTREKLKDILEKQINRKQENVEGIENNENIIIYKKGDKKSKRRKKTRGTMDEMIKNDNPPPKKENIMKLNTFIEFRRKQKEEEEEEERQKEEEEEKERQKDEEEERQKEEEERQKEFEKVAKNINNKEKEENNKITEFDTNIPNEIEESKKRLKNSGREKNENSKKISCYKLSDKIEKNEDNNIYNDTLDKQNISNMKLKSPQIGIIPKTMDSNYIINLNSENEMNKNTKRKKSKKKWKSQKSKHLTSLEKESNYNLMNKKCNTENEDFELKIDLTFLRLIDRNDDEIDKKEYNIIPYLQALRIDKRSTLETFISIFANEIGFLNLFYYRNPYSHFSLTISVYIFELLFDLMMNCFLYTDDVVSEKYNNDGSLSMITSLTLSFVSNIISSIAVIIIAKLTNYPEILEVIISSVKNKKKYFDNIIRLMKYVKLRLGIFYFLELGFILIMTYYLFIFCTVYHQSQVSITINYIIGALTSLAISTGLSVLITLFRVLSLYYHSNRLYNVSRYIYDRF